MEMELARYNQDYEIMKSQLQEMEQLQVELKSQLASSQRLNSLADTKLKCMAESYKSLEKRAQELESEVKLLQAKEENLDNELQEEKRSHKDALIRCKDLEEQMQRNKSCSMCSLSSAADFDIKTNRRER
ncbi:hypothetical protein L1049_025023 [Liquidambar formosana]|uniref:Uncharacterized protein n=1 Tax=Liquidambar formosana TaxID=63359 RepID=A0AAP0RW42_LIQFO